MAESQKDKGFNWFSRVVTIDKYCIGGGPCAKCGKVEGIKIMKGGTMSGFTFIPQRRHKVVFDVKGGQVTKELCTPCKDYIATLVPLAAQS